MDRLLRLGVPYRACSRRGRRACRRHPLNPTRDITVALVGYGVSGRTFHAPLIAATPGLWLAHVAMRSPDAATAVEAAGLTPASLDRVLDDPAVDLVVVATPTADHAETATRVLSAGKHVVIDKPMAATTAQADGLVALAARQGRMLSVFHNRRWDADFLTLRALVAEGVLGDIVEVTSTWDRFRPQVLDRWREQAGPGAGVWFDLGSHMLDQALQLFGAPASLWADIRAQRPAAQAPDYFHVRLGYDRGPTVVLQARSLALAAAPRFVVHGVAGSSVKHGLDPQEAALKTGLAPGGPGWGVDPAPGLLVRPGPDGAVETTPPGLAGDYLAYYAGVRDAILGGGDPPVTGQEAATVVRLLELAMQSAATGQTVSP